MRNRVKIMKLLLAVIFLLIFMTSCNQQELVYESYANHKEVVEDSEYGKIKMKFNELSGKDIRTFKTEPNENFEFDYNCNINSGDIRILFADSKDNIIKKVDWTSQMEKKMKDETSNTGEININGVGGKIKVQSVDNKIKIVIEGKAAEGSLELSW